MTLIATEEMAVFLVQCQARGRTIHKVFNVWEKAQKYFNLSQLNWKLPDNCAILFQNHSKDLKELSEQMKEMFKSAFEKIITCKKLIEPKTWAVYSAARALDPLQMISSSPPKTEFEKIPFSKDYQFGNAVLTYQQMLASYEKQILEEENDPFLFFSRHEQELKPFSSFALKVLDIPTSSAEVERSFSIYKRLVSPNRPRLEDKTIQQSIYINNNFQTVFPNYTL